MIKLAQSITKYRNALKSANDQLQTNWNFKRYFQAEKFKRKLNQLVRDHDRMADPKRQRALEKMRETPSDYKVLSKDLSSTQRNFKFKPRN